MGAVIAGFILFGTVSTATAFGIASAYWAINGILSLLAPRPQRPPVLVASESQLTGD